MLAGRRKEKGTGHLGGMLEYHQSMQEGNEEG